MNKKPNIGTRIPNHPLQRPMQTAQFKPGVAQPKLQPRPGVLQPKTPAVPPHRPTIQPTIQPTIPRTIQAKPATAQRPIAPMPFGAAVSTSSVIQEVRRKKTTKKKPTQRKAVVTLTIGANTYNGVSSGQYGHAEMQALRNFIVDQGSTQAAWRTLNRRIRKRVTCPNQPVCGSCKLVLEALGFGPEPGTIFSTRKSGGVSWGASMMVRDLMDHAGLGATFARAIRAGAK